MPHNGNDQYDEDDQQIWGSKHPSSKHQSSYKKAKSGKASSRRVVRNALDSKDDIMAELGNMEQNRDEHDPDLDYD